MPPSLPHCICGVNLNEVGLSNTVVYGGSWRPHTANMGVSMCFLHAMCLSSFCQTNSAHLSVKRQTQLHHSSKGPDLSALTGTHTLHFPIVSCVFGPHYTAWHRQNGTSDLGWLPAAHLFCRSRRGWVQSCGCNRLRPHQGRESYSINICWSQLTNEVLIYTFYGC